GDVLLPRAEAGVVEAARLVVVLNQVARDRVRLDQLVRQQAGPDADRLQVGHVQPEVAGVLLDGAPTVERLARSLRAADLRAIEAGGVGAGRLARDERGGDAHTAQCEPGHGTPPPGHGDLAQLSRG